jgi:FAD-dependent oxidoreductase family protein
VTGSRPGNRRLSAVGALAVSAALIVGGVAGPLIVSDPGTPPPGSSLGGQPPSPPGSSAAVNTQTPSPGTALVVADVAVYGGTASGVIAAVSAARAGATVVLLEPGSHLGGMVTSGLSLTDVARKDLVRSLTLEFHTRVGTHYNMRRFGQFVSWNHEPHVAGEVLQSMLEEAGVNVLLGQRLDRAAGVTAEGGRIAEIRTRAGTTVRADVFVDSTYEGDLLAAAGVSYAIGREARSAYDEALAGVQPLPPAPGGVPGRLTDGGELLPGVSAEPLETPGSADTRIQPYTFRLCVTEVPANRVPFAAPAGYDPEEFAIARRAIQASTLELGQPPPIGSLLTIAPLPNGKADLNSAGLFSTDYVGQSYGWPDGDDSARERLWDDHRRYVAGFLHFLTTDPEVPQALRDEMGRWGLCRDEFIESDNWPPQLYVREARRMVGAMVLTQRDIQHAVTKPESIGLGAYRVDSHVVRRVLDGSGFVRGEGQLNAPVVPYQIPLRMLLPKESEAGNLVVSVAVSASHVAWTSVRMEPQLMTMGEAAGVVAAIAADRSIFVQDVPYDDVAEILRSRGGRLDVP